MLHDDFDNTEINLDTKTWLTQELQKFGEFRFTFAIMKKNNPSDLFALSNYPEEWGDIYFANGYQYIDPVVITALNTISPFFWDDDFLFNDRKKLKKGFEFAKEYNITNGFTLSSHDSQNNLITLTLLIDDIDKNKSKNHLQSIRDKLQMLLIDTHTRLINSYNNLRNVTNSESESGRAMITSRENEVLYWASMGKTYPEISIIMGIKNCTVKFHMGNAVRKLGVFNSKQAIRLGIELQIITPPAPTKDNLLYNE